MYNITEFRQKQTLEYKSYFVNLLNFIFCKKGVKYPFEISDDISTFEDLKGFNTGFKVTLFNDCSCKTEVFIPHSNTFDYLVYKLVPRLLQIRVYDDVLCFYKNGWRYEANRFLIKPALLKQEKKFNEVIDGLLALFAMCNNHNIRYNPSVFSFDSEVVTKYNLIEKLSPMYHFYGYTAVINRKNRPTIIFISKNIDKQPNTIITNIQQRCSELNDNKEATVQTNVKDLSYENFRMLSSLVFNCTDQDIVVPDNEQEFERMYNEVIVKSSSMFLYYVFSIMLDEKIRSQIVASPSSIRYKYFAAYQQIYLLAEKSITNAIRKIGKRKKQSKDDKIINLATEVVRMPSFEFPDIYNPYTELRTITSCKLPFDELTDDMRKLDKSMYGIICPIDTSDKDPGKIIRGTNNFEVDAFGRCRSSFVYSESILNIHKKNKYEYGHPFVSKFGIDDSAIKLIKEVIDLVEEELCYNQFYFLSGFKIQ